MNNQDNFWTDELVKEFVCELLWIPARGERPKDFTDKNMGSHKRMEAFKASKQNPLKYEILSVYIDQSPNFPIKPIHPINGMIRLLIGEKHEYSQTIENCLNKNECVKIFSVKRISDNCIFSIGDEIHYNGEERYKIEYFEQRDNYLWVGFNKQKGHGGILQIVRKAEPKKQPILTTNDCVDIFEGGRFWFVTPQYEVGLCANAKNGLTSAIARFSIEENADNYVLMNKPCLSAAEIYDIASSYGLPAVAIEKDVTELVKSKIK